MDDYTFGLRCTVPMIRLIYDCVRFTDEHHDLSSDQSKLGCYIMTYCERLLELADADIERNKAIEAVMQFEKKMLLLPG